VTTVRFDFGYATLERVDGARIVFGQRRTGAPGVVDFRRRLGVDLGQSAFLHARVRLRFLAPETDLGVYARHPFQFGPTGRDGQSVRKRGTFGICIGHRRAVSFYGINLFSAINENARPTVYYYNRRVDFR